MLLVVAIFDLFVCVEPEGNAAAVGINRTDQSGQLGLLSDPF
jgi:hypothetical protein